MNILQKLSRSTFGPILVTLNPPHAPSQALAQGAFPYRHPLYTARSVRAQDELQKTQGTRGIWYCGAWTGYGFHEDGFTSGIRAAVEGLGGEVRGSGWMRSLCGVGSRY
jgi:predicted NAD/FAD-binding protein